MRNYKNAVAVITGAGSGIGRALALQLASEGANALRFLTCNNAEALAVTGQMSVRFWYRSPGGRS